MFFSKEEQANILKEMRDYCHNLNSGNHYEFYFDMRDNSVHCSEFTSMTEKKDYSAEQLFLANVLHRPDSTDFETYRQARAKALTEMSKVANEKPSIRERLKSAKSDVRQDERQEPKKKRGDMEV